MQNNYLCGVLIKEIHDEIEKKVNALLRQQDLTLSQMNVLMELEAVPEHRLTLKELEGLLHVDQSTAALRIDGIGKGPIPGFAGESFQRFINMLVPDGHISIYNWIACY